MNDLKGPADTAANGPSTVPSRKRLCIERRIGLVINIVGIGLMVLCGILASRLPTVYIISCHPKTACVQTSPPDPPSDGNWLVCGFFVGMALLFVGGIVLTRCGEQKSRYYEFVDEGRIIDLQLCPHIFLFKPTYRVKIIGATRVGEVRPWRFQLSYEEGNSLSLGDWYVYQED